jgi:hypothetical protein
MEPEGSLPYSQVPATRLYPEPTMFSKTYYYYLGNEHSYNELPILVETRNLVEVNLLWNQQVQTKRIIPNNTPNIIILDNVKGTCLSTAAEISGNRNVIKI